MYIHSSSFNAFSVTVNFSFAYIFYIESEFFFIINVVDSENKLIKIEAQKLFFVCIIVTHSNFLI